MASVNDINQSLANTSLNGTQQQSQQQDGQAPENANYLNLRALVSTREAGIIIGKVR